MTRDEIKLRATRPLWHRAVAHPGGTLLSASAAEAVDLLASGRAALEHQSDATAVRTEARQRVAALLREAGRAAPDPGSPWMPIR